MVEAHCSYTLEGIGPEIKSTKEVILQEPVVEQGQDRVYWNLLAETNQMV